MEHENYGNHEDCQVTQHLRHHGQEYRGSEIVGTITCQTHRLALRSSRHSHGKHDALLQYENKHTRHDERVETVADITHRDIVHRKKVSRSDCLGKRSNPVYILGHQFGGKLLHHIGRSHKKPSVTKQEAHFAIHHGI